MLNVVMNGEGAAQSAQTATLKLHTTQTRCEKVRIKSSSTLFRLWVEKLFSECVWVPHPPLPVTGEALSAAIPPPHYLRPDCAPAPDTLRNILKGCHVVHQAPYHNAG